MPLRLEIVEDRSRECIHIEVDPDTTVKETIEDLLRYWDLEGAHLLSTNSKNISADMAWSRTDVESGDKLTLSPKEPERSLPKKIWKKRIENEIKALKDTDLEIEINESDDFLDMSIVIKGTPGPVLVDNSLDMIFTHGLNIRFGRGYPYDPPRLTWASKIFHPNILPPDKGGMVRISYIEDWNFSKNLVGFVSSIKKILKEPELKYRLDHEICVNAAERYIKGEFSQ